MGSDLRNSAVKLALDAQELVDQLNAGRSVQAARLAEQIAERATAIADGLSPESGEPGR